MILMPRPILVKRSTAARRSIFVALLTSMVSWSTAWPTAICSLARKRRNASSAARKRMAKGIIASRSNQFFLKNNLALFALRERKVRSMAKMAMTI